LPAKIVARAKTCFGVSAGLWVKTKVKQFSQRQVRTKGIESRCWLLAIFGKPSAQDARA